jgi:gluconolactonase
MLRSAWELVVAVGLAVGVAAQGPVRPPAPSGKVERLDPRLDALIPAGAVIEKVATGFQFIEGPVWTRQGFLLFSDIRANAIYKLASDGAVETFRKPSGHYDQPAAASTPLLGSNGLTLDKQGALIICEHGNRRVTRLDANGRLQVVADRFEGKRFNYPNDAIVKSDGSIYFTDPPSTGPGADTDKTKELDFNGIFRVANGKVQVLTKDLSRPNGLVFSPDERHLYLSNTAPDRKVWMRYPVNADGTLGGGTLFVDATSEQAPGVPDGMKVDVRGNLFATGPGGVWVIAPDAKVLGKIMPEEVPANVGWGDDGHTLYMTARTSLYRVRLTTQGNKP